MGDKKKTIFKLLRYLALLFLIVFGCIAIISSGGGGGSDDGDNDDGGESTGISYTGLTSQAVITEDNAIEISLGAYNGTETGSVFNLGVVQTGGLTINGGSRILKVYQVLNDTVREVDIISDSNKTLYGATESGSIDGDCGGTASYSFTADDQTGEFSGSFNFNNYCSSEVYISGQATVTGTIDTVTEEIETMTLTFSNLTTVMGSDNMTMDGDISIQTNEQMITITMEILLEYNAGDVYWIDNYVMNIVEGYSYISIEMEGRFYDPNYGYIDLTTTTPFSVYYYEEYPSEGVLVVTGENNTKARLTSLSSETFQVEADTDGDGSYDYNSGVLYWSDY